MNRWPQPGRILIALGATALAVSLTAAANAPRSGHAAPRVSDRPAGFLYGTDSFPIAIKGSAPYREPVLGSPYGGYIGMTGNWAQWQHCGDHSAWSPSNSAAANTNFTKFKIGIGTAVYWFMGGPGVDPHYTGGTAEARAWGVAQAQRTLANIAKIKVTSPVVFADVELPGSAPGISPAPDNGWNSVYTSPCSGVVKHSGISPAVDRADFTGFIRYINAHSAFKAGVYSAPVVWNSIFGTGSAAAIKGTYEWTYLSATRHLSPRPTAWCLRGTSTCAQFFGGVTSSDSNAVAWQFSGGGGFTNGVGDFDQIDVARMP
jgi:hypothetical protein